MTQQIDTAETQSEVSKPKANKPEAKKYSSSHSEDSYHQTWLESLFNVIEGMVCAAVHVPMHGELLSIASLNETDALFSQLIIQVEQHASNSQPQVTTLKHPSDQSVQVFGLFYPIVSIEGDLIALASIAIQPQNQQQLTQALTLVQVAAPSIEVLEYQHRAQQIEKTHLESLDKVDLLARVLSESTYSAAATRLVTEMAVLNNADRVSFGEYKGKKSRLKYLSHSTQFGKKMNQVRMIERVMDECIDQGCIICFPETGNKQLITAAHQRLSEQQGNVSVISFPIYLNKEVVGAIVLEGKPDIESKPDIEGKAEQHWTSAQAEINQSLASLIFPTLADKKENDKLWITKTLDAVTNQLKRLFGPSYLGRKLAFIAGAITVFLLATQTMPYKLSTEAKVESASLQAIVAPYDGYIAQSLVRAGDRVTNEQLMVQMDNKDLRLEKLKWLSEQGKLNRQYLEALAARDRAQLNIINAQEQQVSAQLELVRSQLIRGKMQAPYNGVVISGDLSQRLGSAVSKGDVLFEVAPSDSYRLQLLVKENRIADLKVNQTGQLYLSALPEQSFGFEISRITPLTELKDGATYFIAEAKLFDQNEQLRSGMEGIGKVEIDERLAISIWTRELVEWVKLQYWSWWG